MTPDTAAIQARLDRRYMLDNDSPLLDIRALLATVKRLEGVVEGLVAAADMAFAFIGAFSAHEQGLTSGIEVMTALSDATKAVDAAATPTPQEDTP